MYFQRFVKWCESFKFDFLPASVNTVCVFLSHLVEKRVSVSVLDAYFYAINWKHHFSLHINPCNDSLVKMTLEGSKRILAAPKTKKEPVTVEMLKKIVDYYKQNLNLKALRICTICILGFSGFLRYSEISELQMRDLTFEDDHVLVYIKRSKTDQERQGKTVPISKTSSELCPVMWLNRYIEKAGLVSESNQFLFSPVKYNKASDSYTLMSSQLSYKRAREIFLEAIEAIGEDKNKYSLHSLRSGGASAASNSDSALEERLIMAHGRWKRISSKDGYVKNDLSKRLSVSKNLGL